MRRRDHRDLALGELARKGVLLVDLRLGPAARAIELRHHRLICPFGVFQPDLVDTVLVAIEAQQAPVGAQAARRDRVQHPVGRKQRIGMRVHG